MPQVFYLAKHLSVVGNNGQVWRSEWVGFPAQYQNGQFVVECKSLTAGGSAQARLFTTWDTDTSLMVTAVNVTITGVSVAAIAADLGPMISVAYLIQQNNTRMVLSVYLTPKSL